MASQMEKIQQRAEVLRQLYSHCKLSLEKVISGYADADFYYRMIFGPWAGADTQRLEILIYATQHARNWRLPREYGSQLILGWLEEDLVAELFRQRGVWCELCGTDAKRELLPAGKIGAGPDLRVGKSSPFIYIDVGVDYPREKRASFWKKEDKMHIRATKFDRLKEHAEPPSRAAIIGIVMADKEYVVCEVLEALKAKYIDSHWGFGRKAVYEINLRGFRFLPLSAFPTGVPLV